MTNLPDPFTRDQLVTAFDTEWFELMAAVNATNTDYLLTKTDAAGWNTRDHLAHLAAWLNSVIVMIRDGQPQWAGLGGPEELFSFEDYDPMNEAIRQLTIDWSVEDVLSLLHERHETLRAIVAEMSDADLLKPVDDFVPGAGDFAICYKIDGNGPHHYREHRGWIEAILRAA
ncbi:MAG: ClbS/DfsB family four-helix bundle protein [Thermomicrobiales bacterium]|nr:ClbS/DfsB family four-helix bundle protein [Thermomicrobiales bacterium]